MKKRIIAAFMSFALLLCACSDMEEIDPSTDEGSQTTQVDSVSLSASSLSLDIGATSSLAAFVSAASEVSIRWTNSNARVLSVTPSGDTATLIGVSRGTSYVSAIAGNKIATCTVNVAEGGGQSEVVVTSITLSEYTRHIDKGDNFNLEVTVNSTGGTANVTFENDNTSAVDVTKVSNSRLNISAKAVGVANITVKAGKKSAKCVVTVEEKDVDFFVELTPTVKTVTVGDTFDLTATHAPSELPVVWSSNDDSVTVDQQGHCEAIHAGSAVISATITKEGAGSKTATCNVTVQNSTGGDYEKQIATWSQPGHLYFHYYREDGDYDKWAVWIWQSFPKNLEGSLWGAGTDESYVMPGVTAQTLGHMTNAQCGLSGNDIYEDDYGIVIDIDLTVEDLLGGKSRTPAPLVSDWTKLNKTDLGFLIVDQTQMKGDTNWTSDGDGENFIEEVGKMMPDGKDSYLHVFCVSGNVSHFTYASGKQEFVNPTIDDTSGKYVSKNDIQDLTHDDFASGVRTSTSFLEDTPGVGYQIFVPSFCDSDGDGFGDIRGIISKLDYLRDLGVKVLWLTPIQKSNSYHGYDVTDYYKIDPRFGTLEDYQELLYKCHSPEYGMKVLMDMVINHTSKSNVLFQKSAVAAKGIMNGVEFDYRNMYLWKFKGDQVIEWDGIEGKTKDERAYADYKTINVEDSADWYKNGTSDYYYYGKFGSGMAELNYSFSKTREYMTDMCKYWLSFGLDGFRLDAIKHIYLASELEPTPGDDPLKQYKDNGDYIKYDVSYKTYYDTEIVDEEGNPKQVSKPNDYTYDRDLNVMFWKQFAGTLKSAYPNCFLVGENFDGWNKQIAPFYESMDSQFDFSTYYHLKESTGADKNQIANMGGDIIATNNYNYAYRSDAINGAFTSNHDVARFINHASAMGDDHHEEVNTTNATMAKQRARWFGAFTMLIPGLSWIYYGDELGMSGNIHDEVPDSTGKVYKDYGNNIDRWYRQPMRWGRTKGQNGVVDYSLGGIELLWDNYNKDLPTVTEQLQDDNSLLNLFIALGQVKNDSRYPTYGRVTNQWRENDNSSILCLEIKDGKRSVLAFINATGSDQTIESTHQGSFIGGSYGATATKIPAYGFLVVTR